MSTTDSNQRRDSAWIVVDDPSALDDEVARRTSWETIRGYGPHTRTHRLVRVSQERLEFRPRLIVLLFWTVVTLAGAGSSVYCIESQLVNDPTQRTVGISIGIVIALAGLYKMFLVRWRAVFDRRRGTVSLGRPRRKRDGASTTGGSCMVGDVHALQLVSLFYPGGEYHGSTWRHELNLVTTDGARIHVTSHGKRSRLQRDAATISQFLNVPTWDATRDGTS